MTISEAAREDLPGPWHVAVVGAGVAGLSCARALAARGVRVTVFESAAAPGGRLAALQTDGGLHDVGAPWAWVQSAAFARTIRTWADANVVRSWPAVAVEIDNASIRRTSSAGARGLRFVGMPAMAALGQHLAQGIDVVLQARVARLARGREEWFLFDPINRQLGIAGFDAVVLAVPSPVAAALAHGWTELATRVEAVRWDACWVGALTLARACGLGFDVARIHADPILAMAVRDSAKPGRGGGDAGDGEGGERWTLTAHAGWSNRFSDLTPDEAVRWMQKAFAARLARVLVPKAAVGMRWHHALPVNPLAESFLWDAHRRIGFAGDWCGGATVDAAVVSGTELGKVVGA